MHKRLRPIRGLLLAFAIGITPTLPVTAQTGQDIAEARVAIEQFEAAFQAGEYSALLTAMPPRILNTIATQSGIPADTLVAQLETQMTAMMSQMTFESFGMDLQGATWGETSTGLTYALVPTQTVMTQPGSGRIRSNTTTLLLNEDEAWYLIRVDSTQQTSILRQAYPEFGSVDFPFGSMEVLD
ncbi:hypothetical protein [Gymnodinialimonas hymeniacidonis]|uniref:hypothetical protein n=1 Tax=Gymnodinialimonas hymeniacidonis TaxID=3126508 RepID=UPI0034C6A537